MAVVWHYAKHNQQLGPVTAAELKTLALSGALGPDDLVWRDGLQDWIPAGRVKGLFESDMPAVAAVAPSEAAAWSPAPEPVAGAQTALPPTVAEAPPAAAAAPRTRAGEHLFDILLAGAGEQFDERFIASTARLFAVCGHYGLYAAMAAALAVYAVAGTKTHSGALVLAGLAWVAAFVVLQYTSGRFLAALDALNRATTGRISSTAFPDCFALGMFALGFVALVGLAVVALQTRDFTWLLPAVAAFIICQYAAVVALHPASIEIRLAADTTVGEEAIGVLSFLIKLSVRAVPVAFGTGVVWGCIAWILAGATLLSPQAETAASPLGELGALVPQLAPQLGVLPGVGAAVRAAQLVLTAAALPLAAYGAFLAYHLLIDVLRAVLALPRILDRLTANEPAEDESESQMTK